jgi:antirestriction protein ArdC
MAGKKTYKFTPKTAEERKKEREEALQKIEKGLENLLSSQGWKRYLEMLQHFHRYSLSNVILILSQMPNATYVAGYRTWKKLNRYVKKGEKGIKILAPLKKKETVINEETGEEEEVEELKGFIMTTVFDVSQTEGEPLPIPQLPVLEGETELYELLIEAFSPHIPIREEGMEEGKRGYYDRKAHCIAIQADLPTLEKATVLLHERAHSILHQSEDTVQWPREMKELEAESVAYVVAHMLGFDISAKSFVYLAGWSKGKDSVEKIKSLANRVKKAADQIIREIEAYVGKQSLVEDEAEQTVKEA